MLGIFNISVCVSLLLVAVQAHPQFDFNQANFDFGYPTPNPNSFTNGRAVTTSGTTTTGAPPTTASPRYLACLQSCPATNEYNPICGSDNVNYFNPGRFDCAVRCGQVVQRLHLGICRPPMF